MKKIYVVKAVEAERHPEGERVFFEMAFKSREEANQVVERWNRHDNTDIWWSITWVPVVDDMDQALYTVDKLMVELEAEND